MIAGGLLRAGATVVVTSRKTTNCDKRWREELSSLGSVSAIPADLSRQSECLRLAEELRSENAELHILVNIAGATWGERLETFRTSGWEKVLTLNLVSLFWLLQRSTRTQASRSG